MLAYILQRIVRIIPMLFLLSLISFIIIQLPPGDYLTEYLNRLRASGYVTAPAEIVVFVEYRQVATDLRRHRTAVVGIAKLGDDNGRNFTGRSLPLRMFRFPSGIRCPGNAGICPRAWY